MEVLFLRANGDEVESSTWISDKAAAVNEQITVLVEFTAPQKPGKYFACYRLVHGDNNRFGDKVFLNLTVKEKEADHAADDIIIGAGKAEERTGEQDLMLRSQKMAEKVDAFAEGEDLDNSIVIESSGAASGDKEEGVNPSPSSDKPLGSALIEEVPAQKLQTGEQPAESNVLLQEKDKPSSSLAESLKIQESSGPSALALPTEEQNKEGYCGDDSMLARVLQSEFDKDGGAKKQKGKKGKGKAEAKPVVVAPDAEEPLNQSEQGAADVQKVAYLQKLESEHYNKDYRDNLHSLMTMGFLDFAKNLKLLQQNHNNLEPVLGALIDN